MTRHVMLGAGPVARAIVAAQAVAANVSRLR